MDVPQQLSLPISSVQRKAEACSQMPALALLSYISGE